METKNRLFNIIIGGLTAICLSLLAYDARVLVEQGQTIAVMHNQVQNNTDQIKNIQNGGSPSLQTHVKDDDTRIANINLRLDKVEAALITLSSMPGEIKAVNVRLDVLKEGQSRMEAAISDLHKEVKK